VRSPVANRGIASNLNPNLNPNALLHSNFLRDFRVRF
jgi:hypothetical protein